MFILKSEAILTVGRDELCCGALVALHQETAMHYW